MKSAEQQARDLFVRHDRREVFDEVTTAVNEPAIGSIDLADGRLGRDHSLQPRAEFRHDV